MQLPTLNRSTVTASLAAGFSLTKTILSLHSWRIWALMFGLLIGIAAWGGPQPLAGQEAGQTYWTQSQEGIVPGDGRCVDYSPLVSGRTVSGRRPFEAGCVDRPMPGAEIEMPGVSAFATGESSGRLLPRWVLPALGAGAAGSWFVYDTIRSCRDSACMAMHLSVPYAFVVGGAAGAAVGWGTDWVIHAL